MKISNTFHFFFLAMIWLCVYLPVTVTAQSERSPSAFSVEEQVPDAPVVKDAQQAEVKFHPAKQIAEEDQQVDSGKAHPLLNNALDDIGDQLEPKFGMHIEALLPSASSNIMAVLGFILAFFMPILGLTFSIIGLIQINQGSGESGKSLAIAGIVISAIFLILAIAIIIVLSTVTWGF